MELKIVVRGRAQLTLTFRSLTWGPAVKAEDPKGHVGQVLPHPCGDGNAFSPNSHPTEEAR